MVASFELFISNVREHLEAQGFLAAWFSVMILALFLRSDAILCRLPAGCVSFLIKSPCCLICVELE
jgi:hypothetical protein